MIQFKSEYKISAGFLIGLLIYLLISVVFIVFMATNLSKEKLKNNSLNAQLELCRENLLYSKYRIDKSTSIMNESSNTIKDMRLKIERCHFLEEVCLEMVDRIDNDEFCVE